MKRYTELAGINARHNLRQSRMTVLCIVLAVFLITSVFSMVDFEYIHTSEKLIRDHGNWHIMLTDVPIEEAESVWEEADVEVACRYDTYNYDLDLPVYINGQPLSIIGTERVFTDDIILDSVTEGEFPRDGSQLMLNQNARSVLGLKVGDRVSVQTPAGDYSFTVSGFCTDTPAGLTADALTAVLDYAAFKTLAEDNGQVREPAYCIRFEKSLSIKSTIARLKADHGWTEDNVSENTAVLGILGMSSNNYVVGLYGLGAALVLLVMLAGIFMISGSMNADVAQRTQFFGMLRCIGAGKRQVRRLVRLEALNWLKVAIPIGVAASIVACWIVCAVLAYGIGGEWSGMPVGRLSFIGIGLGAVTGFITVLFSAAAPAKKAARVSPIAAVSGGERGDSCGGALTVGVLPVDCALGVRHAVSKKKGLGLMTGSFALSIILFLFFSTMLDWVDNALTTTKVYTPHLSFYQWDYAPVLSDELAEELRSVEGVRYVYGRRHISATAETETGETPIDLISYDALQLDWAERDVLRGDMDKVRSETGSVVVPFDKNDPTLLAASFVLDGKTLTVDALLSDSPFEQDGVPTLICSEDTFKAFAGDMDYSVIDMQLEKSAGEKTLTEIRSLLPEGITLSDRRASIAEVNSTYLAFTVLVYVFLGLVALISALNIVNSISMSVTARRREYGMMRAIGLEKSQLVRMIRLESLTYALAGCAVGCAIGIPLNAWFFRVAITNYWGIQWTLPVTELAIVLGLVFLSALAAVSPPAKRMTDCSIVETIAL